MDGGAARLVHALKYEGWFALAKPMGEALATGARRIAKGSAHRLEPVPLPPARLRERGFNQAALLARSLGDALGWPVGESLTRAGSRRRQVRLGRNERRENVMGAFHVTGAAGDGLPVLLVDDVLTTGATATACAGVLEAAGRRVAGIVVFARALQVIERL
jgi:predicted amidophosphoribosyltransferase